METFEDRLRAFEPITLQEMESVKLMNRTDTKFVFHKSKLNTVLESVMQHYRALEINDMRNSEYRTLYYDTPTFDLYLSHHNERINRYKIRYRTYVSSNIHFFEIKQKNNKGRTIKSRVQRPGIEHTIEDRAKDLLEDVTNLSSETLAPVFWVNYSRITFVSKNMEERLTIDTNLTFKNENMEVVFGDLIIAELKQDKASLKSPFAKAMNNERIKENSISKYCLGVIQLIPNIKKNNFKPKLLTLNKVLYAPASSNF